jgi:hypothetical protein
MKNEKLLLVAILSLIFASCDKDSELENKELSGQDVPVRIHSMNVAEGGSENPTRSSSQQEPEIVTSPIGDGMLLEMSIKQDDSPLRDKVELAPGTHFRVIAVTGGRDYYSHGDYVYGSGTLTPSNNFNVKVGQAYDFICISYNSTTLPSTVGYTVGSALPSAFSVADAKDLLWWKSTSAETISASGIDLDITLKQKLAKVKVIIDCSYNKWKIMVNDNYVRIGTVALSNLMNLSTGDVDGTSLATRYFPSFSATVDAMSQTSELRIMPKASSEITISVGIGSVLRDGLSAIPSSATGTVKFTTPLIAGTSYTITVRLRTPIWARSNIYWKWTTDKYHPGDGGKLTFVPAADDPAQNDDTKAGYQGVLFKWGSLVGISPAQTDGSDDFLSQDVPIYVPIVNNSTWEATTSSAKGWTSWGDSTADPTDIPYMDKNRGVGIDGYNSTWLIDAERNVLDTINGFRGDICQYLTTKTHAVSGDYRLPMSKEFVSSGGMINLPSSGWISSDPYPSSGNNAAGEADGTANLLVAAENNGDEIYGSAINSSMDLILPASGFRDATGMLFASSVGTSSVYWTGSASSANYGYGLYFYKSTMYRNHAEKRSYGFSVRCVKN